MSCEGSIFDPSSTNVPEWISYRPDLYVSICKISPFKVGLRHSIPVSPLFVERWRVFLRNTAINRTRHSDLLSRGTVCLSYQRKNVKAASDQEHPAQTRTAVVGSTPYRIILVPTSLTPISDNHFAPSLSMFAIGSDKELLASEKLLCGRGGLARRRYSRFACITARGTIGATGLWSNIPTAMLTSTAPTSLYM